jgi:hypothetical protein
MKILVPKAPLSAVAAATAFHLPFLAPWSYETKAEGGSCCYRTPSAAHIFIVGDEPKAHGRLCGKAAPFRGLRPRDNHIRAAEGRAFAAARMRRKCAVGRKGRAFPWSFYIYSTFLGLAYHYYIDRPT